jgi:hypothetical protein
MASIIKNDITPTTNATPAACANRKTTARNVVLT